MTYDGNAYAWGKGDKAGLTGIGLRAFRIFVGFGVLVVLVVLSGFRVVSGFRGFRVFRVFWVFRVPKP